MPYHLQHMAPKATVLLCARTVEAEKAQRNVSRRYPRVKPRMAAHDLQLRFIGSSAAIWPDVTARDAEKKVLIGTKEKAKVGSATLLALMLQS